VHFTKLAKYASHSHTSYPTLSFLPEKKKKKKKKKRRSERS
jgi:hypothetical protein